MCAASPRSRSRFSRVPRSRCSWRGLLSIGLLLALSLTSWPISAQSSSPISRLGESDYASFQADLLTVRQRLTSYEAALRQAIDANASISAELKSARAELQSYKDGSTQYYPVLLAKVETLSRQLIASKALVDELRQSLESAQAEYGRKLSQARAQARTLERERNFWRAATIVSAVAAVVFGIKAAMK